MIPRFVDCAVIMLSIACAAVVSAAEVQPWGAWTMWGDQGDGTYRNPVLPADFSDLDCIRVGDDFYAISSTMQFSPGMTILHSTDLVNWAIAGHAVADLTQIGPELNWDRMNRYGRGVWAGSIRHHAGKFWVVFGTPDEGYFVTSATDVAGPWAPLHPLLAEPGWDDCSILWDDDGQAWFVGTQFGAGKQRVYRTYLFKISPDARALDRASAVLLHEGGHREANKLIRANGWYYLIHSRHTGGIGRWVVARRAKRMTGPWSDERQLAGAQREAKEPNQGGVVQAPNGEWYFFTHHGTGDWEGRAASLLPVTWIDDWPILGKPDAKGVGSMVWSARKPVQAAAPAPRRFDDDFDAVTLARHWQWNYQPRSDKWSLTERPGWLRLHAFRPLRPDDLMKAGNTLTQRTYRTPASEVIVKLDLSAMADGQKAGLCHFARTHSTLAVVQRGGTRALEYKSGETTIPGPAITGHDLWLKSTWGLDGKSRYAYSLDGRTFTDIGEPYQLTWGHYRGDRVGVFSFNNQSDAGHVDVDSFHYNFDDAKPARRE